MDVLNSDTEHTFLLPVALIFQNESVMEDRSEFGYNSTTPVGVNINESTQHWKKEESGLSGVQRLEKVGDTIKRELKWAFILHAYGFGCLFFILAFYTFFSVLNIRSFISSKPFMSTINGFLCLLGTSRAASLFIDPYHLKENMPKLFGQVLWDLGFPSIISAFCLVQLAFLQFTQIRVGPEGLRRKSCLSLIVTAHFLLTIGMDIVAASNEHLVIVKHVVHYIFLTWGVFLCSNFLYTGYKVMSMIRSLPVGLKQRELPDAGYKGIMQLAILSPHNNLAGSMTAALLPTLCAPKIHQQDNTSLSTVGFRSDGNSRILESESIPMLEEMTGSSGDEISPKPLTRGSSFQNQSRNSQKFNLKPKLSLRSVSNETETEENVEMCHSGQRSPKSPKSVTPKTNSSTKGNEFDFNMKPTNGILKHSENISGTRSNNQEFKNKLQSKTCFENENFSFPCERRQQQVNNSVPEILVSGPGTSDNCKDSRPRGKRTEGGRNGNDRGQKTLNKLMNEISKDLNEMQILREEKSGKSEEVVEVHEGRSKCECEQGNGSQKNTNLRRTSSDCRKQCPTCGGTQFSDSKKNDSRKEYNHSEGVRATTSSETSTSCCNFTERKSQTSPGPRVRGRKKGKSLPWKKKAKDEEEKATQECLLLQDNMTDVSLRSVLNHIAYMNRGPSMNGHSDEDLENVRKTKVEWVLNITYITAMWGLMLSLSNMGKIYSPFGVPEPNKVMSTLNSTYLQDVTESEIRDRRIMFSSWPWLWFQTFCRALELAMGCAMANITRQPAADHRYPRASGFRNRDTFYSI